MLLAGLRRDRQGEKMTGVCGMELLPNSCWSVDALLNCGDLKTRRREKTEAPVVSRAGVSSNRPPNASSPPPTLGPLNRESMLCFTMFWFTSPCFNKAF